MQLRFKPLAMAVMLSAGLASFTGVAQANLSPTQNAEILKSFKNDSVVDFKAFLGSVRHLDVAKGKPLAKTITAYLNKQTLTGEQQQELYRLLGLYARVKYGQVALEKLTELVAIPTARVDGVAQHENPEFIRIGKHIEQLSKSLGLSFRNIDNRVFEVSLPGSGDEVVGLHVHADVVPANPANWVLEDGTKLDPYKVTKVGDRLYGRGTEDDKNGIVVSLYALKVIKDEHLPLARSFKLLIDTTEETTSDAIPYYFARNPTPAYNLALDGGYPVVIAEKGYGTVMADFPRRAGTGKGAEIINLTGGLATNQIPSKSIATFISDEPESLLSALQKAGDAYVQSHGGDFSVNAKVVDKQVLLTVTGVSAHSSSPQSGVNPVARLLDFVAGLEPSIALKHNHITDAARYAADNWGLDYFGGKLGIGFSDDFMGPLTTSLTYVALDDKSLKLAVNLRVPKGQTPEQLQEKIAGKLELWLQQSGVKLALDYKIAAPMYRDPSGEWVKALLSVASENLGLPSKFGTSAGATSVHELPNGVQFGLARPDEKYTGHTDNEFKTLEQFQLDLQIVTEMVGRIGQLPKL
ncbi:dipeptidase [Pseudomonas sp. 5P_3.1_Bac2]|uniref:dipeptidase n=1 Tax=Pseudomonas sp. 5P_3.1_Bac2 TaxID=2971617 RepID=UPI0021CA737D|nr:dipeptidase [Pseudomonas sp. 5P_3.1_Bac2]MCU1717091.1 dipeptidase [Pseudomonas sp. 5P_3.1_Bac2]